jgi:hypothetical protein
MPLAKTQAKPDLYFSVFQFLASASAAALIGDPK